MIKRDIQPQWQRIADWYWKQHDDDQPIWDVSIWDVLERDYGAKRIRPMGSPGWSVLHFPNDESYTMFLLRWS